MRNKKAQVGEFMADTAALIFIAIIIIIFFAFSGTFWGGARASVEKVASEESIHDQSHYSVYAWLQKPVEIEIKDSKENVTIADLIRLSEINSSYKALLDSEMHEAFDSCYSYNFKAITFEDVTKTQATITSLGLEPRFYLPSDKTTLVVLQIERIKK